MNNSLRILVVEDEMMIAFTIEDYLTSFGHEIVGPASRVDAALQLARTERLDLALLDINIAGQTIYPVAEELKRRGIPFIFMSGYGASGLPADWIGSAVVEKPFTSSSLLRGITAVAAHRH